MYTNEAIASFLDKAELPLAYLYYALPKFIIENASTNIYGAKILNQELISNAMMFAPPYKEAEKIADFLDHQTIKIDTLIEKQQQLIQLLQEKRQAVISHSVTKGLNPAAKMRDSGIEWLGEVPEHWTVTRLKHVCSHIIDCPHSTPEYDSDGDYPAIRTADINIGLLDLTNCRRVTKEIYNARNFRLTPKHNDIIYSREGARFGLGALVPEGAEICLAQRVMLFRTKKTPEYVMWALNSQSTYKQAQQDVMGSASPHINVNTIENFSLAWPPEIERKNIAHHIRITTELMDKIISISSSKINSLQERRAALISAAVTGKIDVRNSIESKATQTDKDVAA
jgi:type I restriction enzyme S subunit